MPSADPAARAAVMLDDLFRTVPDRQFAVRLWDGSTWHPDPAHPPRFTLAIHDPGVLRRLVLARDEAALGAGYVAGEFDLEGNLEAVVPVAEALLSTPPTWRTRLRILAGALRLPRDAADGDDDAARTRPTSRARTAQSGTGPHGARELLAAAGAPAPGRHSAVTDGSPRPGPTGRTAPALRGRRHSLARDRAAVTYHYDASNDFYRLFLDPRMVYYFASPDEPLETAQERKLDYVCRKLRLRPGERLLDIGCGWGGLIVHAAARYGVSADGITLSEQQATVARERIREAGLVERCTVRVADYRDLDTPDAYDKLASVGMFEHVGEAGMDAYFRQAARVLRPGGAMLNHAIAGVPGGEDHGQSFADRWVFPDHELLPINVALRGAERAGFDVRDVENLREHYALTLRHWVRRLEERREEAIRAADEPTWRAWRLTFAAAAHQFDAGKMHLYQALLVKPGPGGRAGVPLTRGDWY